MVTPSPAKRKRVRLEDVARRSEISIGAASMALRDSSRISAATRERVRAACRELGYRPPASLAKAPRRARTATRIGLALVGRSVRDAVYAALLHELSSTAHEHHFRLEVQTIDVPVSEPRELERRILEFAQPCAGLLLCGSITSNVLRSISARHPRVVLMGLPMLEPGATEEFGERSGGVIVAGQDQAMGRAATHRLFAGGHRRIAFIAEVMPPARSHARWREGYRLALADVGLPLDPALERINLGTDAQLLAAMAALAALPQPPTAYVVTDLRIADLLLRFSAVQGRPLPHDAMVIWGSPAVARLYGIADRAMIGIDLPLWVQTGLACVLTPPTPGLAAGNHLLVPFITHNLPAPNPVS